MSNVQYISFENGAPRLALPADYTTEQIQTYLKSDKFQQQMANNGYAYMYGLTPVNLRDPDNLNDNSLQAGAKSAVHTLKQIGQGALATMYDAFGAEEKQAEAIKLVQQYQLDQQAHKWRQVASCEVKRRVETLEQVFESEQEFSAFLEWLGNAVGQGAVTSVPFFLAGALTGGIGAVAVGTAGRAVAGGFLGAAGRSLIPSLVNPTSLLGKVGAATLPISPSGLGLFAAGYGFGAGDTYVNQLEETDDPNAAIALAAGVPYAFAESAFGAGAMLLRTMTRYGGSDAVKKSIKQRARDYKAGKPIEIDKKINKATKADRAKAFGKGLITSQSGELVAEGLQEAITQTGQAVEGGRSLSELYASKDFWKQVGEGAAAGFAGGGPFGAVGGTIQAMRVGPSMDITIKGGGQNIKLPKITGDIKGFDLDFNIGDLVTYIGAQVETESTDATNSDNYNQPEATDNAVRDYIVGGLADFDGKKYVTLIATDNKTEMFVPVEGANNIISVKEQATDTNVGNNFIFNEEQTENVNTNQDNVDKEYQANLDIIRKRGYNTTKQELGVDNESKKSWVQEQLNNIKQTTKNYTDLKNKYDAWNTKRPDMRNSEGDESLFYDIDTGTELDWDQVVEDNISYQIPGQYKEYLPYFDDDNQLKAQLNTRGWKQERLRRARNGALNYNQNQITEQERNDLNELGYDSPEGQRFVNSLLKDEHYISGVGSRTNGRNNIRDIIKKKITFQDKTWQEYFGDTTKTKQQKKTEVPVNQVPAIDRIGPATIQEFRTSLLGDGLYEMKVAERLNAILVLVNELDTVKSAKFRRGLEKSLINQLKSDVARYKSIGATDKARRAEAQLEAVLNESYVISSSSGVVGSYSENARVAVEIKLTRLENKDVKTETDNILIENYRAHLNNIKIKRDNLNKLLATFNVEPILTNEGWNSFKGVNTLKKLQEIDNRYTLNTQPSAVGEAWMEAKQGTGQPRLTENFARNSVAVLQALRENINKLGLDIKVDLVPYLYDKEGNEMAAGYIPGSRAVTVSLNGIPQMIRRKNGITSLTGAVADDITDIDRVNFLLYHEVMHVLSTEGFFKQHEFAALKKAALDNWIDKYNIRERYSANDKSVQELIKQQNISYEDLLVEEAISEAFADYMTGRFLTKGPIARAFEKLRQYLIALGNALTANRFNKPEAIFNALDLGIVGQRFKSLQRTNVVYDGGVNGAKIISRDRNFSGTSALEGYNLIPYKRSFFFASGQDKKMNTKEFFNWFNNGGRESVVTTKNGAPLVVMHTTITAKDGIPFTELDMEKSRDFGMHFTATQRHIDYIQMYNSAGVGKRHHVFKGFLQLHNPLRMNDLLNWKPKDVVAELIRLNVITPPQGETILRKNPPKEIDLGDFIQLDYSNFYKQIVKRLQDQGYDGIVYENIGEDAIAQRRNMRPPGETPIGEQGKLDMLEEQAFPAQDSYIIFKPNQFKHVDNAGPYNTSNNDMMAARQWQETQGGMPDDQYQPMNRQQERDLNRRAFAAKQGVDASTEEGAAFGGSGLSWINRWFGTMREWAKNNLPFAKLFTLIQTMQYKAQSLQAQLTNELAGYRLIIESDPSIAELLRKAQAISQWYQQKNGAGVKFFKNANGQIIFRAPEDFTGGPKEINIEPGEVVILEGDVANAFLKYDEVMDKALNEIKKGEIAGAYTDDLIEAVTVLNKLDALEISPQGPQQPWSIRNLSQDVLDFGFESITKADLQLIIDELLNQANRLETIGPLTSRRPDMTQKEVERLRSMAGFNKDGTAMDLEKATGFSRLSQTLEKYERMATGTYIPLMRFGEYYISVVNPNKKEGEEGRSVEYIMYESKREAEAAFPDIQNKYINNSNAQVNPVSKQTLPQLRQKVKDGAIGILDIGQYLSESNAKTFNALQKELEKLVIENKDIVGFDQFMIPRSQIGGVGGYSADFGRAAEQFIFMASRTAARNRFMPEARQKYNDVLSYARDSINPRPRLEEGVKTFWDYTQDPKQEFATFRQIGFWWYLGGNMSSAILQVMSNVQFTGPMLAEITPGGKGNLIGRKGATAAAQLLKAQKDAAGMLSFTNNQFGDTFIDWTKAPADVKDFIKEDMAGYLKQGQAMHEAGQVPGTESLGSRQRRLFRMFENAVIGGMFNTVEATSRLTAYIALMRTLMDKNTGGQAIELAKTLFEGDQLFQEAVNRNGGVVTPQIIARHVVDDTFGVYGKLNRPAIMRKYGSVPALFQTYITQMFALMYRMLAKGSTPAQRAAGRRVFLRMMGMIVLTGGMFGIPGSDDAEDLASWMVENVPVVGTDLKTDFRTMIREMLYDMGMGAQLVNAVENGFIEAYLNLDVQRRLSLGNIPFSQQIRAMAAMTGLSNGGSAADFAGAPGSVFITPIKESFTAMREGRGLVDVAFKSAPLFIRNGYKAYQQSMGKGFVETNYGTVLRDDTTIMENIYQAMGFGSARTKRAREAEYMSRFYETRNQKKQRAMNAQLTNAYRDIIMGNKKNDSALSLKGQQKINELTRELYKWNSSVDPKDAIYIDLNRAWDEAIKSANKGARDYSLSPQTKKRMDKFRRMYDF